MSRRVLTPPTDRSEIVCAVTILAVTPLLCIAAAVYACYRLPRLLLYAFLFALIHTAHAYHWLRYKARRTWEDLYADRHELAAYLLALAFLAFIIFLYPHQP